MPRFPRNYIKSTYFHVITQGINKNYIFEHSEDIKYYIKIMYLLMKEQDISIIAYCIMNNHAHILIRTEKIEELSKYMQRLNIKYGRYYNKKYNRVGYVFRNRYKAEGIYNEEHLYSCIKYIYNNPVKAGICEKAEEYPYSNFKKIDKKINNDYSFLELDKKDEKICKNAINDIMKRDNLEIPLLKKNTEMLRKVVIELKDIYKFSLRNIADGIDMNREKIRRIYNNK